MMQENNIPQTFCAEAVHISVHIINKAHLRPSSDKTPYELWNGKPASIKHFRIFGSNCYIKNNDGNLGKFDARVDEGIFLGYASKIKGYRCYNKTLQKIVESIDVRFDEELPNNTRGKDYNSPLDNHEEENQDDDDETSKTIEDVEPRSKAPSRYTQKNHPEDQIIGDKRAGVQTRRQLTEQTKEVYIAMPSQIEPKKFEEDSKDKYWVNAMNEELDQI